MDLLGSDFRWRTPLDVLNTDEQFPGLANDIDREMWYRALIRKEVNTDGKQ